MTTSTATKSIKFSVIAALALGAPLEGGTFAGVITQKDGTHVAVVLLSEKPAKRLPWAEATAWAESVDGQLPSRPISALLYANLKSELEETWHWTNETCSWGASCAWFCGFGYGFQYDSGKSCAGSARAVRLIHLED